MKVSGHFHKLPRLKVSGAASYHCEMASWRVQGHNSSARGPDWLLCANPTSAPAGDYCVNYAHSSPKTHLSISAVRKYLSSNFHIRQVGLLCLLTLSTPEGLHGTSCTRICA
jgi:hypothetical protein